MTVDERFEFNSRFRPNFISDSDLLNYWAGVNMRAWRSEHSEVQTRPSRPMTHSQSPERSHRDERSQSVRKRSRSREREHQGRSSADRGAVDRRPHGHTWGAPPPLLSPPAQDAGVVLSMSASHGRAISADGLRPNAAALDSRALTQELGRASTLTELLSLEQSHGDRFDHFNLVSFWSKFKKLPRGELGGLRDRLAPVCELTVRMLPTLSAREVSNLSHALAGLVGGSGPWENVWAALPSVALRLLVDFDPQHLANTAWAFAKAGHVSAELFNAISAEVVRRRLGDFNPQALSNTAWAFAKAGHLSTELLNAISAEVVRRGLGDFKPQELSNTAWAFAVWNPPSADKLFGTTSFTTRCAQLEKSFACLDLSQLHQWSLWREERGAQWPGLPKSLRQACRDAFTAVEGEPSQLQSDIIREIRSCGARVEEEHRCEASGYTIDALVTMNDGDRVQVAVEVDGPSHFVGRSQHRNGATLLKHRQLRHFEWRLISVSYWDWDRDKRLPWLPCPTKSFY